MPASKVVTTGGRGARASVGRGASAGAWLVARMVRVGLLILAVASPASAQDSSPPDFDFSQPQAPAQPAESLTGPSGSGAVDLALESFGVGGVARRGEWTAVRLVLTDQTNSDREVVVRVHQRDNDGDMPLYEGAFVLNRGQRQGVWLYLRTPFEPLDAVLVSAWQGVEDPASPTGFRAGELLARAWFPIAALRDAQVGLIGVVGRSSVGLSAYGVRNTGGLPPGSHEPLDVAQGLTPEQLPDRWMGLAAFDTLVWVQGDPTRLAGDRAAALREWVARGGHLVVVVPPTDAQLWPGDERNNPVHAILPRVRTIRREGQDLEPYRALLTRDARPLPSNAVVHVFEPIDGVDAAEAVRLIEGGGGECLVVRREVGVGAVTLIGFDLASGALTATGRPDTGVFWHRVLGKRGRVYSAQSEIPASLQFLNRQAADAERGIAILIEKQGQAAAGVLLGFVVFVAYWLVAAPGCYLALKAAKRVQYSWLAFAGAIAIFTAIAWGGARLIRPSAVSASHVTILDHVYGQPTQSARAWFTLLVPWYGDATLRVGEPDAPATSAFTNSLSPWHRRSAMGGFSSPFPDTRGYVVGSRRPDSITFPVRATVKQFQADWAGGPRWSMPTPVPGAGGEPGGLTLRVREVEGDPLVTGVLTHNLPGVVRNVMIFVVAEQRELDRTGRDALVSVVEGWSMAGWAPGEELDFARVTAAPGNAARLLAPPSLPAAFADPSLSQAQEGLRMSGLISQLEPPSAGASDRGPSVAAQRSAAHGFDLGPWFTRPSVIVIGTVGSTADGAPSPVPITLEGDRVPTSGITFVRWIYPLGEQPLRVRAAASGLPSGAEPDDDDDGGGP